MEDLHQSSTKNQWITAALLSIACRDGLPCKELKHDWHALNEYSYDQIFNLVARIIIQLADIFWRK